MQKWIYTGLPGRRKMEMENALPVSTRKHLVTIYPCEGTCEWLWRGRALSKTRKPLLFNISMHVLHTAEIRKTQYKFEVKLQLRSVATVNCTFTKIAHLITI